MSDAKLEILLSAKDMTKGAFSSVISGVDHLSGSVISLKGAMAGIGAGAFAYMLSEITAESVSAASALEEAGSKFDVVFDGQIQKAGQWSKALNDSYGMSIRESKQYLSSIQDLLVPMGMVAGEAGNLSNEVVKLAADLGSFNNQLTSKVIDDYQSALVGNYETMKKYGVVLTATSVQAKALEMGLARTKNELTASDTAQAAHQIIVESSTAAIGDFIRTSDGYANTTKELDASWEDFTATLGEKFLPTATKIKGVTADILDNMTDAIKGNSLDDQIAEAQSRIDYLLRDTAQKEADVDAKKQAARERRAARQRAWEQRNLAPSERESAKYQAAYQKKVNDELRKRPEIVMLENAQLELAYLLDKKRFQEADAHSKKKNDLFESEAEASKKAAAEAKKAQMELNNLSGGDASDSGSWWDSIEESIAASKKYDDFMLSHMDTATQEYKDLYLKRELEKWAEVEGITKDQLTTIEKKTKESLEKNANETALSSTEVWLGFTNTVQSELSGLFTDTLRGELDSFEDYFSSFTDSMISMWGSMMSQMTMNQLTGNSVSLMGMGAGASFGMMGVAGVALAGVGNYFDRKEKRKAERRQREQERRNLESQFDDDIAKSTLSDMGYDLWQTNKRFEEMGDAARRTGADLEKLNTLRELESERIAEEVEAYYKQQMAAATQPYDDVIGTYTNWMTDRERSDWGVSDWTLEISRLNDQFQQLSSSDDAYFEIAEKQLEATMTLVDVAENQLESYENTQTSLNDQIWDLNNDSSQGPVSSDAYQSRYDSLLELAETPINDSGDLSTEAIQDYQNFVDDYISAMDAIGVDHAETLSSVTDDLEQLSIHIEDPMAQLTKAIKENTSAVGVDGVSATKALIYEMQYDRNAAKVSAFSSSLSGLSNPGDMGTGTYSVLGNAVVTGNETVEEATAIAAASTSKDEVTLMNRIDAWENYETAFNSIVASIPDDLFTDEQNELIKEWQDWFTDIPPDYDPSESDKIKADAAFKEWQNWFLAIPDQVDFNYEKDYEPELPKYAYGGWSDQPSVFGEAGPEWAVPAFNNPNNSNFLKSVGMDKVIAAVQNNNNSAPLHIHLTVDGRELSYVIIDQARKNPELKRTFANA